MASSKKIVIVAISTAILLFILGWRIWNSFFMLAIPFMPGVQYFQLSLNTVFKNRLLFSLTLALIPIATIIVWRHRRITEIRQKIITVCIILLAMSSSVILRREMIRWHGPYLKTVSIVHHSDPISSKEGETVQAIPIEALKFEVFAFAGLLAGSMISLFLLKKKS